MQQEESRNDVYILIRDGAGEDNVLRIKSSTRITKQKYGLISISLSSKRTDRLLEEIGGYDYLGRSLAESISLIVPRVKIINFRPQQVILDIGIGNIWNKEEETAVIKFVDDFFASRSITTHWSLQRKAGESPNLYIYRG